MKLNYQIKKSISKIRLKKIYNFFNNPNQDAKTKDESLMIDLWMNALSIETNKLYYLLDEPIPTYEIHNESKKRILILKNDSNIGQLDIYQIIDGSTTHDTISIDEKITTRLVNRFIHTIRDRTLEMKNEYHSVREHQYSVL